MNAHELADALLKNLTMEYGYTDDYMEQAATMLRHQADRILELDVNLKAQIRLAHDQADRIAELEKRCLDLCFNEAYANQSTKVTEELLLERIAELEKENAELKYEKSSGVYDAEPVAWMDKDVLPLTHIIKAIVRREEDEQYTIPLYTTPQTKPLSDEEILSIYEHLETTYDGDNFPVAVGRAIEERIRNG